MVSEKTNKELLDMILLDKERLDPGVLAKAEEEFKKRNISNDEIVELLRTYGLVLPKSGEYEKEKLGFVGKAFAFLFPGLLYIFYIGKIRTNVFSRRANDVRLWTTYGLGFYIILVLIVQILLLFD